MATEYNYIAIYVLALQGNVCVLSSDHHNRYHKYIHMFLKDYYKHVSEHKNVSLEDNKFAYLKFDTNYSNFFVDSKKHVLRGVLQF